MIDHLAAGSPSTVFYLDGKRLVSRDAYVYLLQQGFSPIEAEEYLNLLLKEAGKA